MLEEANKVREEKALKQKWRLYKYISSNPGLTIYELGKKLGWSTGKVHYYIQSLIDEGMIKNTDKIERGRNKKTYSSAKVQDFLKSETLTELKNLKKP